jgi:hypothetical protein
MIFTPFFLQKIKVVTVQPKWRCIRTFPIHVLKSVQMIKIARCKLKIHIEFLKDNRALTNQNSNLNNQTKILCIWLNVSNNSRSIVFDLIQLRKKIFAGVRTKNRLWVVFEMTNCATYWQDHWDDRELSCDNRSKLLARVLSKQFNKHIGCKLEAK